MHTTLYLLLAVFGASGILLGSEYAKHQSPVVLNSLPATKVKCDTSSIKGYCSAKGIYENKWMEAQK